VGKPVSWDVLHQNSSPMKISLPTYPFAKARYWVADEVNTRKAIELPQQSSRLHPLVGQNSSTLKSVRFTSTLSSEAWYAQDHQINAQKILPGAAFVEIAAICGNIAGEQKVNKVKDIVWITPLSLQSGEVNVETYLKTIGEGTEYQVTSLDEDNERVVHCEGRLYFDEGTATESPAAMPITLLKEQCPAPQDGAHFYQLFKQFGFDYGPAFQGLKQFYINDDYALSKLTVTDSLMAEFDQYILHPSIIDGALQTVIGLVGSTGEKTPYLPFALDEIQIIRPLTQSCYVYVEFAGSGAASSGSGLKKFNIQLLSDSGEVLVRLNNFYVRALGGAPRGEGQQVSPPKITPVAI
jgi:acyl transferase domain-containing protein